VQIIGCDNESLLAAGDSGEIDPPAIGTFSSLQINGQRRPTHCNAYRAMVIIKTSLAL
jgi:hypothetical protein